jgi:hypothetical protein
MQFHPKALLFAVAAILLLWYAIENQFGPIAIFVNGLLAWGLWTIIPNRWFNRRTRHPQ